MYRFILEEKTMYPRMQKGWYDVIDDFRMVPIQWWFVFLSWSICAASLWESSVYSLEAALGIFTVSSVTAALLTCSLALSEKAETMLCWQEGPVRLSGQPCLKQALWETLSLRFSEIGTDHNEASVRICTLVHSNKFMFSFQALFSFYDLFLFSCLFPLLCF